MRLAWVCNKAPLPVSRVARIDGGVFGGWLDSTATSLLDMDGTELLVLFPYGEEVSGHTDVLSFHSFPADVHPSWFAEKLGAFRPDVVHVWGTEAPHSLKAVEAACELGIDASTVVSIQGLVSICGRYHYAEGVPETVMCHPSFGDFIRRTSLEKARLTFIRHGEAERECLRLAKHVIGRTEWDKACAYQVNPSVKYHHCNESLRDEFYAGNWNLDTVERHSLFVSQCSYPVKGFHYALQALSMLKDDYPDVVLYTTGETVFRDSLKRNLGRTSYQLYIARLIDELGLRDSVKFLGSLDATAMRDRYLRTHVFVSPSTIENSPNSVGEAMLLGCPVVSSNVGGVADLLEHGEEGFLYQTSAPYMLAWYVRKLFEDDDLAIGFSRAARKRAARTHDRGTNLLSLLRIYDSIAITERPAS